MRLLLLTLRLPHLRDELGFLLLLLILILLILLLQSGVGTELSHFQWALGESGRGRHRR